MVLGMIVPTIEEAIIIPVIRAERGPDTVKVSPLSKNSRFVFYAHYQSIFPMNRTF